jgi:hypothetical protein
VKCRRREQSSLISDGIKCSTPSSVASDDVAPPQLQLPESYIERMIVYPTPPYLTPGFHINPALTEIRYRPGETSQNFCFIYTIYILDKYIFR